MSNPSPLDQLVAWLERVPDAIASELAGYILVLSPEGWFPQFTSIEDAREGRAWIVRHLSTWIRSQHANVGGALGIAAIIDFVLATRATTERWTDLMDRNSQFLFKARRIGSDLEDMLLGQRRRDEAFASMWIALAADWRSVRETTLSANSVEAWARDTFACFMGIGFGPASAEEIRRS